MVRKTIRLQARSSEGIASLLTAIVRGFDPECDVVVEPFGPSGEETWPEPPTAFSETPVHPLPRRIARQLTRVVGAGPRGAADSPHYVRVMASWSPDRIAGPVLAQIVVQWVKERQVAGSAATPASAAFYGPDGEFLSSLEVGATAVVVDRSPFTRR